MSPLIEYCHSYTLTMMGSSSCTLIPAIGNRFVLLAHGLGHGGRLFLRVLVVFARQHGHTGHCRRHESVFHLLARESRFQVLNVALNQLVSCVLDRPDVHGESETDA